MLVCGNEVLKVGFLGGRTWYHTNAVSLMKIGLRLVNSRRFIDIPQVDLEIEVQLFDEFSETAAFEGAFALVEKGVIAIIGTESSSTLRLAAIYCSNRGIPVISHSSVSTELTDKSNGMQYLFRAQPTVASQHKLLAHVALDFGWEKLCYLAQLDENSASQLSNLVTRYLNPAGIQIATVGLYGKDAKDGKILESSLDVALNSLHNSGCRIVVYGGYYPSDQNVVYTRARDLDHFDDYVWISLNNYLVPASNQGDDTKVLAALYQNSFSLETDSNTTFNFVRQDDAMPAQIAVQKNLVATLYQEYANLTVPYICAENVGKDVFGGKVNDPIFDFELTSSYPNANPPLFNDLGVKECVDGDAHFDTTNNGANIVFDIVIMYAQALAQVYEQLVLINATSSWPTILAPSRFLQYNFTTDQVIRSETTLFRQALIATDLFGLSSRYRFDPETQDAISGLAMYAFDRDDQGQLRSTKILETIDAYFTADHVAEPNLTRLVVNGITAWPQRVIPRGPKNLPYDGTEVSAKKSYFRNGIGQRIIQHAGTYYETIDLFDYFGSQPQLGTVFNVSLRQSSSTTWYSLVEVSANRSSITISYPIVWSGSHALMVQDIYTKEIVSNSAISVVLNCPPGTGWIFDDMNSTGRCGSCPAGKEGVNGQCIDCEIGKYRSSDIQSLFCLPCPIDAYTSKKGSETCTQCPENARRDDTAYFADINERNNNSLAITNFIFGTDIAECTCPADFYTTGGPRKDAKTDGASWGKSGYACLPCPEGARCSGSTYAPQNKKGWWGTRKYNGQSTRKFYACNPANRCATNYKCTRGRQHPAELCSVLKPFRYFQIGGLQPKKCFYRTASESRTIFYVFVVGSVFCIWLFYNLNIASIHSSLALMNHGLQMMAIISLNDIAYPSQMIALLEILFSFSLFDADILTPSCIMRWRQIHSLYAAVLVSCFGLIFFLPLSLRLIFRLFFDKSFVIKNERLYRHIRQNPVKNKGAESWRQESLASLHDFNEEDIKLKEHSICWWLFIGYPRAIRMACHFYVGEYGVLTANCVANAQILLEANYANTLVKFLLATTCQDGRMRLDPSIRCRSKKHMYILWLSALGSAILIGWALALYLILRDGYHRVNGVHEPHLLARYGWLYGEYASPLHMYSMLLLLETGLFSVVAAYISNHELGLATASLISLSSACVYLYLRPFEQDRYDVLRVSSCIAVSIFTFASFFTKTHSFYGLLASIVILITIVALFCLAVWVYYLEVLEDRSRFYLRRKLFLRFGIMEQSGGQGRYVQIPVKMRSGLREALSRNFFSAKSSIRSSIRFDESFKSLEKDVEYMTRPHWLHRARTRRMYRAPLPSSSMRTIDFQHSSIDDFEPQGNKVQSLGRALDEMVFAISGIVHQGTIFKENSSRKDEESFVLKKVAHILKPNIIQESPLSPYTSNFKASFWRILARAYPGIIAFAADSLSDHERKIVFAVLVKLQRFLEQSEHDERARALDFAIEEHARSAVLYSILSASEQTDADAITSVFRAPLNLLAENHTNIHYFALPKSIQSYIENPASGLSRRQKFAKSRKRLASWLSFKIRTTIANEVEKEHDQRECAALQYLERHHHQLVRGYGVRDGYSLTSSATRDEQSRFADQKDDDKNADNSLALDEIIIQNDSRQNSFVRTTPTVTFADNPNLIAVHSNDNE